MRILLDLQALQTSSANRGIGRYSLELSKAVANIADARGDELLLLVNGTNSNGLSELKQRLRNTIPNAEIRHFNPRQTGPNTSRPQTHEYQYSRESAIRELKPDLIHIASLFEDQNFAPLTVKRFQQSVPTTVTLYDLIPLLRPSQYLVSARAIRDYQKRLDELIRADKILTISNFVKREAIQALRLPEEWLVSVGTGSNFSAAYSASGYVTELVGNSDFIVVPSGEDPRKNMDRFLDALILLDHSVLRNTRVIFAGHMHENRVTQLRSHWAKIGGFSETIVFTGFVSDEALAELYTQSSLVVFPSLHEGFGLPALEAMICDAPVLVSRDTSMSEIVDFEGAYFDPYEPSDIAAAMNRVLKDESLRDRLVSNARDRVPLFTWNAVAEKCYEVWDELVQRGVSQLVKRASRRDEELEI